MHPPCVEAHRNQLGMQYDFDPDWPIGGVFGAELLSQYIVCGAHEPRPKLEFAERLQYADASQFIFEHQI